MILTQSPELDAWPSTARAWFLVAVLMTGYTCAFIDRQILSLLVEPIRRDLDISDTQLSLLSGLAFMIFYIGLVMPLAGVADRLNRRTLVSAGVAFWSVMTACCGLASGFASLFVARMGVGVGEAALSPAAYSMIADSFPPARRARAMTVYSTGALAGAGLALIIGGIVIQWAIHAGPLVLPLVGAVRTWQLAFFVVSMPGVLVLVLLRFTREPQRHEIATALDPASLRMRNLLRGRARAFFCTTFGFALLGIAIASYMLWAPTVLVRTYGWSASQAGLVFGSIMLFGSTTGAVLGGIVADRLAARGIRDAALRTTLGCCLAALPFAITMPLAPGSSSAAALLAAVMFAFGMTNGLAAPTFAAMVPNQLRARLFGLYFVFGNPIAFVVGPTGVALISDHVLHDPQRIGTALALLSGVAIPLGVAFFAAARAPFRRCVELARQMETESRAGSNSPGFPSRSRATGFARPAP
jgi:MFS family permease